MSVIPKEPKKTHRRIKSKPLSTLEKCYVEGCSSRRLLYKNYCEDHEPTRVLSGVYFIDDKQLDDELKKISMNKDDRTMMREQTQQAICYNCSVISSSPWVCFGCLMKERKGFCFGCKPLFLLTILSENRCCYCVEKHIKSVFRSKTIPKQLSKGWEPTVSRWELILLIPIDRNLIRIIIECMIGV